MSCKTFGISVETKNQVHTNTKIKLKTMTLVAVSRKLALRLETEPNDVHDPWTKLNEQNTCINASIQIGRANKSFNWKIIFLII